MFLGMVGIWFLFIEVLILLYLKVFIILFCRVIVYFVNILIVYVYEYVWCNFKLLMY